MNGEHTNDVDVFLIRLKLLNYYKGKMIEFKEELDVLETKISSASISSNFGIKIPYGETEVIDGQSVRIEFKNISIPSTHNGFHQPNQANLWRMEELETMIIQYQCEIDYLVDTLEICSQIVCDAAKKIYVDGETWQHVSDQVPMNRSALERKIKREIGYALKGANATKNR